MPLKTWTRKQLKDLERLYPTISNPRDLVPVIGKSYEAIKAKAGILGLLREVRTPAKNTDSPEAIAYLQAHYLTTPVNHMAVALNRSETYVKGAMKRHKLKQPRKLVEQFKLMTRIQPGNVPKNKGRKQVEYMTPEAIERTRATRFQKGGINHNTKWDGAITVRNDSHGRPYKYIRMAKSRWKLLQVHVWEQANGPVPKGMVVAFKDGNSLNVVLENLELITRQELMVRNSASVNLSDGYVANCIAWRDREAAKEVLQYPELIALKRESIILNRTINEQSKRVC